MGAVRQLEYFKMGEESDGWGVVAPSLTGFAPDEYGVEVENEAVQMDKFTGEVDDVYVDVVSQALSGSMNVQAWPDNIAVLLAIAGLPREADYDLKSYTVQAYDRAKNEYLQHLGLKADSVEIAASGSDPKLRFNFDLVGQAESTISSFEKPSLPSQPSFELSDCTFTIGGNTEANVTEFSISVANNLVPSDPKNTSRNIKWLDAGRRQVEVSFTVRTDSTLAADYRNLVRTRNRELSFVAAFNYPGTGSPIDALSLTLDRLVLRSAIRTGGAGDIQTIACTAVARKPAATDSLVASAT